MITWAIFAIAFVLGTVAIYLRGPMRQTVYMHPTPDSTSTRQYRDKAGVCFAASPREVACDEQAKELPVQAKLSPQ
jgi:hypothetical protein